MRWSIITHLNWTSESAGIKVAGHPEQSLNSALGKHPRINVDAEAGKSPGVALPFMISQSSADRRNNGKPTQDPQHVNDGANDGLH